MGDPGLQVGRTDTPRHMRWVRGGPRPSRRTRRDPAANRIAQEHLGRPRRNFGLRHNFMMSKLASEKVPMYLTYYP